MQKTFSPRELHSQKVAEIIEKDRRAVEQIVKQYELGLGLGGHRG